MNYIWKIVLLLLDFICLHIWTTPPLLQQKNSEQHYPYSLPWKMTAQ